MSDPPTEPADGAASPVIRLHQRQPRPNGLFGALALIFLCYVFGGWFVFWLQSGSTTIGVSATFTPLGTWVWLAPMIAWLPIALLGDRGPLRVLYVPRGWVEVAPRGASWWTPVGGDGSRPWDGVGGVSSPGGAAARLVSLYDRTGRELVDLEGPLVIPRTRRNVSLPEVVLATHGDRFVALDPSHPERGCVHR